MADTDFTLRNINGSLIQLNQTIEKGFNNVSSKLAEISVMLNNKNVDVDLSEIVLALGEIEAKLTKK